MNKYDNLLLRIASTLNIKQGISENEANYKSRLIYSAVSRIGYASLWDKLEDEVPVSIEHFRLRIENTLDSYMKMYPEIRGMFNGEYKKISETMYNIFLDTGNIYHSPKRIAPLKSRQASYHGIEFLRGTSLSENNSISGIGTYTTTSNIDDNADSVLDMFDLTKHKITDYWQHYLEQAVFTQLQNDVKFEYLKTVPPILHGYWNDRPDKNGEVSMMRTVNQGTRIYYFYKSENNIIKASQIPYWLSEEKRYLYLTNGCLACKGVLPSITYRYDGAISYLQVGYLLPPSEQNMIMLYSWPLIFSNSESPFSRIIDTKVLKTIIKLFKPMGFTFKEE